MLANCFKHDFRKIMLMASIVAVTTGFAITGFAIAASHQRPVKATSCVAKAAKLQMLHDAEAPLLR